MNNIPKHITQDFIELIRLPNSNAKRLNYLLVMLRIAINDYTIYMVSYGFCLVSSTPKASSRNVFTLNLNYKSNPYKHLQQVIVNNSIDVVATGGLSGQFSWLKEILDTEKSVNPSIITIVGDGVESADNTILKSMRKNISVDQIKHVIAAWPAKLDIIVMLNYLSSTFVRSDKVVCINANPNDSYVLGSERFGKKIYAPDEILNNSNIDTVLYAFGHRSSSKVHDQINKRIKTQYPNVKQVVTISELLKKVI